MADRLISADALKREMWRRCGETDIEIDKGRAKWDSGLWIRYKVFEECIEAAPTLEAEPRKHGRWRIAHGIYDDRLCCTVCGHYQELRYVDEFSYCPRCGAKMDEVEE